MAASSHLSRSKTSSQEASEPRANVIPFLWQVEVWGGVLLQIKGSQPWPPGLEEGLEVQVDPWASQKEVDPATVLPFGGRGRRSQV